MAEDEQGRLIARLTARFSKSPLRDASEDAFTSRPPMDARALAGLIDHTALKPDTTETDVRKLCDEAVRYGFASVCVNPCHVPLCAEQLQGTPVAVCTAISFPLGANATAVKAQEAEWALRHGAGEVDMVMNLGLLKSGRYDAVEQDIRAVVDAVRSTGAGLVKVILETALLTEEEKIIACILAGNAGADFVKTSTGFSTGGATEADVSLLRRIAGNRMGVKASGGIRTYEDALRMTAAGATRIGASASVAIVTGGPAAGSY